MARPRDPEWPSSQRTVLKHRLYSLYLNCWMPKILQAFPRAVVVDGFAGPGRYSDGHPGSSVVVANAFLRHSAIGRFNDLTLICNEDDAVRRDLLDQRLAAIPTHPNLTIDCRPASDFETAMSSIDATAHQTGTGTPTLWLLDPFGAKDVPFSVVRTCLANPRDEVILTWFTEEIDRFYTATGMTNALDQLFGSTAWTSVSRAAPESHRKELLLDAYCGELETLPNVRTGRFSISTKNETARLTLIFATHDDKGLQCWNDVKWKLDPGVGRSAAERRPDAQGILFSDDLSRLKAALRRDYAGHSASFADLLSLALREGYQEKHLRDALEQLSEEGLAAREEPIESKSHWPPDSAVRLWDSEDNDPA